MYLCIRTHNPFLKKGKLYKCIGYGIISKVVMIDNNGKKHGINKWLNCFEKVKAVSMFLCRESIPPFFTKGKVYKCVDIPILESILLLDNKGKGSIVLLNNKGNRFTITMWMKYFMKIKETYTLK